MENLVSRADFKPSEGKVAWEVQTAACWFRFSYVSKATGKKPFNLKVMAIGFPSVVHPGEEGTVLGKIRGTGGAAELLDIHYNTLFSRMKKLEIK